MVYKNVKLSLLACRSDCMPNLTLSELERPLFPAANILRGNTQGL